MRWVLCVEVWRGDTGEETGGEWMHGGTGHGDGFETGA